MPHAVSRLRAARLTGSALPGLDRDGPRKPRCKRCRLSPAYCVCALRLEVPTHAGICLLMAEFEPLKPSNTGWLVADVLPDTFAFSWARTQVDPALLALLADPQWQPVVVFPGEFAAPERVLTQLPVEPGTRPPRRPLFILLDGTWSEARKMFGKSPYLAPFPVLSLAPAQAKRYQLRRSHTDNHLCTAEVAALCLALAGEAHAAQTLDAWLDVFSHHYVQARQAQPVDPQGPAYQRWRALQAGMPLAA
jgi:DTW domain-containing protein